MVRGNRFFLEGHQNPAQKEERGGGEIGTSSVYCLFTAFEEVKDDLAPFYFSTFKDLLFFLENRYACRWTKFVPQHMQMYSRNFFSENSYPLYLHGDVAKKAGLLPSCPLTPSLPLVRQALSLPEMQDSCHFTNRGHSNTAGEPRTYCK